MLRIGSESVARARDSANSDEISVTKVGSRSHSALDDVRAGPGGLFVMAVAGLLVLRKAELTKTVVAQVGWSEPGDCIRRRDQSAHRLAGFRMVRERQVTHSLNNLEHFAF